MLNRGSVSAATVCWCFKASLNTFTQHDIFHLHIYINLRINSKLAIIFYGNGAWMTYLHSLTINQTSFYEIFVVLTPKCLKSSNDNTIFISSCILAIHKQAQPRKYLEMGFNKVVKYHLAFPGSQREHQISVHPWSIPTRSIKHSSYQRTEITKELTLSRQEGTC